MLQNKNDEESSLDDKVFLKQLEDRWSSKEKAVEFIYSMLKYRYIFDRYIIKREYIGETKSEGTWSLKRLEKYIDKKRQEKPSYLGTFERDNKNNILKVLESCLRVTYTSHKTMHWIASVMNLAKCKVDVDEIINELESYCCKKVEESHPNEHRGFSIERIVFTYLDYILYRDNINEFKDFYFQFRTSIEQDHRDDFGNLALITTSANSVLSNKPPEYKVKAHKKVLEQSPKFKKMADLLENGSKKWDDNLVNEHGQEMINLLDSDIRKRK